MSVAPKIIHAAVTCAGTAASRSLWTFASRQEVHALARAVVEGARKAGAHVRLRKVAETAPAEVIDAHPAWARHHRDTAEVTEAGHGDLEWADAVLFGTPTRFGNPAAQLRQFIDTTGPLWFAGKLTDKVYSSFTASNSAHGGQEPTLLALGNTFYHWDGVIVPPGYTDPVQLTSGNPYGTSAVVGDAEPGEVSLAAARHQARRVVEATPRSRPERRLSPPSLLPSSTTPPKEYSMTTTHESELRALFASRADAQQTKDIDRPMSFYAADAVYYDVAPR